MMNLRTSWLQFTPKTPCLVKWCCCWMILGALLLLPGREAFAQKSAKTVSQLNEDVVFSDTDLPPIEARTFELRIAKFSRSRIVYLMDDDTSARPAPGKIILLRRDKTPVMAFRILKVYHERRQIAAKRIRYYGGILHLQPGETYTAIEKLADVLPSVPAELAADRKELEEFEEELEEETGETWSDSPSDEPVAIKTNAIKTATVPQAAKTEQMDATPPPDMLPLDYDPELDAESSPPPFGAIDSDYEHSAHGADRLEYGVAADDKSLFEHHRHMISAGAGWSFNSLTAESTYNAAGFRYSYTLRQLTFLRSARLQDAFAAEFGMFVYKPIYTQGSYTVMPFTGSLRYDIQSVRGFSLYGYLGLTFNGVIPGPNADLDLARSLYGLRPAGGIGFLFPFGPNWNVRANAGIDSVDLGLALRF